MAFSDLVRTQLVSTDQIRLQGGVRSYQTESRFKYVIRRASDAHRAAGFSQTTMPDDEQTYFDKERDRLSAEIASVRASILILSAFSRAARVLNTSLPLRTS